MNASGQPMRTTGVVMREKHGLTPEKAIEGVKATLKNSVAQGALKVA